MIKQECIGIPDMILLLMIFCFKKIKIKAEIVLSPGGAYFLIIILMLASIKTNVEFRSFTRNTRNFSIFWAAVIKYSNLITSRVQKPFR